MIEEPQPNKLRKYGLPIAVAVLVLGGLVSYFAFSPKKKPARKSPPIQMVDLTPPPPVPTPIPTPPPATPEPEPQEMEKQPEFQPEEAPSEKPQEEAPAEPEEAMGTDNEGEGGQDFGLKKGGGSLGVIGGGKKGSQGGTKWGHYAGQVQGAVQSALQSNKRTRSATMTSLKVRIWADEFGRVTRAKVVGSTGDPKVDDALRGEVLRGLQLPQPPPEGMPMPIVMQITGRRP